ncbi:hypothetical protein D0Z00_004156 [Geotrichum galactomycetum]|uniref:Uncharacterized protein n=1 Tax=Geotrichum galactomycetum TaxID=27317 RepID=A0ACB6UZC7_9ASCO|nr:hypothetical protein D0Z00_004156 [Geotrichum candidum]
MPLPELSPRPTSSSISNPVRKSNAQAALAGQVPFEQIKHISKPITQSRTLTTEPLITTPAPKDKHKAPKKVAGKSKDSAITDTLTKSDETIKSTTASDKKKPASEPRSKKTPTKAKDTPTKASNSIPKTKNTHTKDIGADSVKEFNKTPTKITTKAPTAPTIISPVTHSNPKTATAINILAKPVAIQPAVVSKPVIADASSLGSVSVKETGVQSSTVTEKKIPAKTTSTSKVTKSATKTKAKPATTTSKTTKSATSKKKIKSPEVVTASDDEDEADKQPNKNITANTPSAVASGSSKPKTAGSKTSRTLVPASKFDLFNLDSSLVNDSDSDTDIYDSVTNPIKPISQSPVKNSVNGSSKTPIQPTLVEGLKQAKSLNAAKTVNVTGAVKDPKHVEAVNDPKTRESSELAKKPQSTQEVKKSVLTEASKRPELSKDMTESEPKKTASAKRAKKAADTKVTTPVLVKESRIETVKDLKPAEPTEPVKEVSKPDLKKADPPKEVTKPVSEPKKPESVKNPEPVTNAESVKKPDPVKEVKTLESKPAEQAAKIGKASTASLNDSQKTKPVLDSSESESESDDDDGSDIPSSPEPTKRLVAVNTPSVTKSTSSQTSSRMSSFIDVLDRKPLTDVFAVPITNSVVPLGNTSAAQPVAQVENAKSQPPKRIAGIQSLSALAKRAIPEVHDSTSSKIQSQKAKAVTEKPVVEVSSDESSSDDDSDDDDSDDDDSDDDSSDDDSDDDEPKVKIGGRADKRKKKSKNRGFMKMIKAAKRT